MGEECNATDKPGGRIKAYVSDSDIEKMKRTVKEAIEAGALGFSTNRFQGHRDTHGTLIPGTCSTDYEQAEICKGMAEGGGGVYQMVSDMRSYDDFAPAGGKSENSKQHRHYLSERDVIGFIGSMYQLCFYSKDLSKPAHISTHKSYSYHNLICSLQRS